MAIECIGATTNPAAVVDQHEDNVLSSTEQRTQNIANIAIPKEKTFGGICKRQAQVFLDAMNADDLKGWKRIILGVGIFLILCPKGGKS